MPSRVADVNDIADDNPAAPVISDADVENAVTVLRAGTEDFVRMYACSYDELFDMEESLE